jgi:hypothetical protein
MKKKLATIPSNALAKITGGLTLAMENDLLRWMEAEGRRKMGIAPPPS